MQSRWTQPELVQSLQEPIAKALLVVNARPPPLFSKDWVIHTWILVRVEVAIRP